jgi:uncharacterized cofD-like protein
LVVLILGTALIGLGLAYFLLDLYRAHPDDALLALLTLRAFPRWLRAVLLAMAGAGLVVWGVYRLNRSLLAPYVRPGKSIVDAVAEHRRKGRGPKIVAIGGGNGLATLLRGLKAHTGNLTAIVTVADDGGSSGRLRKAFGLPPPGDLRNCLAALSDDEDLLTQLFQYRFTQGEALEGHAFGNLFIAALSAVSGSFDRGILEAGRVLAIQGRVVPATLSDVVLLADKMPSANAHLVRVEGESRIPVFPGTVGRVHLDPNDAPAYPEAIHAILNADMIVIGPGSLYTSILPNLLITDITQAVRTSRAFKVYVCNVATQAGETEGYDCLRHVRSLEEHVGRGLVDLVVANDDLLGTLPPDTSFVTPPKENGMGTPVYIANLADRAMPWRHDSRRLADVLIALLEERTGPLEAPAKDRPATAGGSN